MNDFRITSGKGFHLSFDNGLTLSTQFGAGNYSTNYDFPHFRIPEHKELPPAATVEIAIWEKHGDKTEWRTKEMTTDLFPEDEYPDDVRGYVPMADWLRILDWCRNYKPKEQP